MISSNFKQIINKVGVLNVLFGLYIYLLAPYAIKFVFSVSENETYKNPTLGIFVFCLMLLEAYFSSKKLKIVKHNNQDLIETKSSNFGLMLFFLGLGKMAVSVYLVAIIGFCFGYDILQGEEVPVFFILIFIVFVMRDFFFAIISSDLEVEKIKDKYLRKNVNEKNTDVFLLLYLAVVYTFISGFLDLQGLLNLAFIHPLILPLFFFPFFVFFYWSSRLPYVIEEMLLNKTWKDKLLFFFSNYIILYGMLFNNSIL